MKKIRSYLVSIALIVSLSGFAFLGVEAGSIANAASSQHMSGTDGHQCLSPTLTLFASPYGKLYFKMQRVLLRTTPLEIAARRTGPKTPEYGISASEWRNAMSHLLENRPVPTAY